MTAWRCFFLSRDGNIQSVEQIDGTLAATEALELCRLMLVGRASYEAFELWRGGRRVHAELRHAAAS